MLTSILVAARLFARACDHNPLSCSVTLFIYFLMFNMMEAVIEKLLFGEPFAHALDIFFAACFIAFGVCSIWFCAEDR